MSRLIIAVSVLISVASKTDAQGRWTTETRLPKSTQETSVIALDGVVWVAAGKAMFIRATPAVI